ncbi:MAG: glycosyltransferase family 2 protein [Bryobacteraceae bacterium]
MPKLSSSVAMCTYNGARFLGEQLSTIAQQTEPPKELVVFDDCSTDETVSILESFASQAAFPVRILVNAHNLGPARNFEKAIEACDGDIIVFSDQDDLWRPHKLASLGRVFEQHPEAMYAFSDAEMVDQLGKPTGQGLWEAVLLRRRLREFIGPGQLEILLRHNLVPGASMAFRASFRKVVLPLPPGWMHDYWIALLGSTLSYGVPVDEVLFKYRRHADQACGWRKKNFAQTLMDSLRTRHDESWKKIETFRHILSRVHSTSLDWPADRIKLLEDKEIHLARRAKVRSASGIKRVTGVLAEACTGRYHRFSNSWYSVIRDL